MQKILTIALIAGLVAGIISFGVQQLKLVPLILQAEKYETVGGEEHSHTEHSHLSVQIKEESSIKRTAYTLLANVGVGVGFALVLVGAFTLRGGKVDAKTGVLWGLAGFATFTLAPSFGLAPELPTSIAADLSARQIWWLATVAATASGLALIAFAPKYFTKLAGVVLVLLPHVIGAPEPEIMGGAVPTELNAKFAAAAITASAIFWVVLGAISGWIYDKKNPATLE